MFRTLFYSALLTLAFNFFSCKKDKLLTDSGAKVQFSQDSILFDTVFTSIGSATRNFRIRNKNNQKIKISSIQLAGGSSSAFKLNVDGSSGVAFEDLELAANDSMYVFVQVGINPGNINSPFIVRDSLLFIVNGNKQQVQLEAWGQNAYYHRPKSAIKFIDGSFLAYSLCDSLAGSFTNVGSEIVWNIDKPHVIYGYCVVDSLQKLKILAGTKIYLNYRASLWVYRYGQIQVLGQKGNEVVFQGARREKDYEDEPGQWDRIWINEGSNNNIIDYAIIKNGYIGIQAELFGNVFFLPKYLKITNTKIQNMSKWGLYGLAYNIYGANNVISNCQEHSLNLTLGGKYTFIHCTFANFWNKQNVRENSTIKINNYVEAQILPLDSAYFGNCIVDGKLSNEISLDIKASGTASLSPKVMFSNSWLKTTNNISDANQYLFNVKSSTSLKYRDIEKYNFETDNGFQAKVFYQGNAFPDANKFPLDINIVPRNTTPSVTAGAYH